MVRLWLLAARLVAWKAWCLLRRGETYEMTSPSGRVVVCACSCGACSITARDWYWAFRLRRLGREAEKMADFLRIQGCEIEADELGLLAAEIEAEA